MGRRRCSLLLSMRILVVASVVSFFGLPAIVVGAESLNPSVGDSLEVRYHGEWQKCEVVELLADGRLIRAKLGNGRTVTYSARRFRDLASKRSSAAGSSGINADMRIWKDASGKHSILARFVELANDKVVLNKNNGSTIKIALDKLSDVDQDYVNDRTAGKDPAGETDKPLGTSQVAADEEAAVWAGVRDIALIAPAQTNYQPDVFDREMSMSDSIAVPLPPKSDVFEKTTGITADPAGPLAFVSRAIAAGSKSGFGAIDVVDLNQGALLHSVTTNGLVTVTDAIHGKRPRFLSLVGAERDKRRQVSVWEVLDGKPKKIATWSPYAQKEMFEKPEVVFAKFVDAGHVMTVSAEGVMAVWKVDGRKALYRTNVRAKPQPILSEGRKYVVVGLSLGLCVVEVKKGKIVLVLDDHVRTIKSMAFSPDGTRLATVTMSGNLDTWDLSTGEKIDRYTSPPNPTILDWVSDDHILLNSFLGDLYLYDLDRRITLWQYRGARTGVTRLYGNRFSYAASSRSPEARALFAVSLPHEEALQTAASLEYEKLLVLKPGADVTLRMETHLTPEEEGQARKAIESKLKENEVNVVASSDLVLEAASHDGESREVTYRMWGSFRELTRTVTPVIYELKLFENGKNVWSKSGHGGPGFQFSLKENETLDDALRRLTKPSPGFFRRVEIPKLVTRLPEGAVAYGASELAYGGLKSSNPSSRP